MSHLEDITPRKMLENEIALSQKKSTALAMAVTASHEINQPLMIIKGNIELLLMNFMKDRITPKQAKYITNIEESLNRIDAILSKFHNAESVDFDLYSDQVEMVIFPD